MNTPFTRRAEAFADALDRSAAGSAVDAAAAAAGVAPLLFLVERLTSVPLRPANVGPSIRAALMSQAAVTLAPVAGPPAAPAMTAPSTSTTSAVSTASSTTSAVSTAGTPAAAGSVVGGLPAALGGTAAQLVAGVLSVAVAVSGAAVGAYRSVPGDALYGLKRLVERAERGAAGSTLEEARALSDEATTRLAELRRLLDRGASGSADRTELERVERLVADLSSALGGVLDRLATGDVPQDLLDELTATWNALAALVPTLPTGAQTAALNTLSLVNNRLGALVDGASPVNGGVRPSPDGLVPSILPTAVPTVPTSSTAPTPGPVPTPSLPVTPTTIPSPSPTPSVPVVVPTPGPPAAEVPGPVGELPELPLLRSLPVGPLG